MCSICERLYTIIATSNDDECMEIYDVEWKVLGGQVSRAVYLREMQINANIAERRKLYEHFNQRTDFVNIHTESG